LDNLKLELGACLGFGIWELGFEIKKVFSPVLRRVSR